MTSVYSSVLMSLVEPLLIHNYHVLSYNSRGVGGSTGWSSFTGFNEGEDLKAISRWAIGKFPDVRSLVILVYPLLVLHKLFCPIPEVLPRSRAILMVLWSHLYTRSFLPFRHRIYFYPTLLVQGAG